MAPISNLEHVLTYLILHTVKIHIDKGGPAEGGPEIILKL